MTTYYDDLKVPPTANTAEIEAACEALYNQWRRLVTHHDPNVVNQANQALQHLETIRATLTDPAKRSVYDAAIGLSGPVGGLADPEAILRVTPATLTPPPPRPTALTPSAAPATPGLWTCPKCGADNPAQTVHCFRCGTELVRKCPECGGMSSLVASGFCGQCGSKYEVAAQRAELKAQRAKMEAQRANLGARVAGVRNELSSLQNSIRAVQERKPVTGCGWFFIIGSSLGLLIMAMSAFNARSSGYTGVGIVLLILAGVLLFGGLAYNSSQESKKKAEIHNLAQQVNQKQQELSALDGEYPSAQQVAQKPASLPTLTVLTTQHGLYAGCAGFLILVVVASLVVVVANFLQKAGQNPTPTLASGIPATRTPRPTFTVGIREATPTPGPIPSPTSTVPPTATKPTLKVYSNSAFGFSVQYPDDWQAKEARQQVILAPGADGLTTSLGENPTIKAVAFVVSVAREGIVDTSPVALDRAIAGLPIDPASSETGTRTVNGVEWAISQVKLNPSGDVGAMTAYVAATTYNNNAYTVLAAAPAAEWNARAPIFQQMFDSLRFTDS